MGGNRYLVPVSTGFDGLRCIPFVLFYILIIFGISMSKHRYKACLYIKRLIDGFNGMSTHWEFAIKTKMFYGCCKYATFDTIHLHTQNV